MTTLLQLGVSTGNTYILSCLVFLYIMQGVLRCLLRFLALWGQKPCGGNYGRAMPVIHNCKDRVVKISQPIRFMYECYGQRSSRVVQYI